MKKLSKDLQKELAKKLPNDIIDAALNDASSVALLRALAQRGGHPGALAEAALLCAKKSEDYNQGMGHTDMHTVNREVYFPFGLVSYTQMLHTKVQRLISLSQKPAGETNFESSRDTLLDIINYAGFALADTQGLK